MTCASSGISIRMASTTSLSLHIRLPEIQGRGYIFFGRTKVKWAALATGNDNGNKYVPAASADIIFLGNAAGDRFGYRFGATSLGDIDGDGYDDFALPACKVNKEYIFSGATISATNTTGNPATVDLDPETTACRSKRYRRAIRCRLPAFILAWALMRLEVKISPATVFLI